MQVKWASFKGNFTLNKLPGFQEKKITKEDFLRSRKRTIFDLEKEDQIGKKMTFLQIKI